MADFVEKVLTFGTGSTGEKDDVVDRYRPRVMKWVLWPWKVSAASMRVSERVGWGWMVRARSTTEAPISMANTASVMSSPASGPEMAAPRTCPLLASAMSLVTAL